MYIVLKFNKYTITMYIRALIKHQYCNHYVLVKPIFLKEEYPKKNSVMSYSGNTHFFHKASRMTKCILTISNTVHMFITKQNK